MTWLTLRNICNIWQQMCSICRNHSPVLSSIMTFHCSKSNTTGATNGARNRLPFRSAWIHTGVVMRFMLFSDLQISLFVLLITLQVMASTLSLQTHISVVSVLAATLYQGNPVRNQKLWHILSTKMYAFNMQVLLECCYK